jgi:hypothetical protein
MDLHLALLAQCDGVGSGLHLLKEEIEALPTVGAGWFNTFHHKALFSSREEKTARVTGTYRGDLPNP